MHKTFLLFACLACAGYGRRVQNSAGQSQSSPMAERQPLGAFTREADSQPDALARLLLALQPEAAFSYTGGILPQRQSRSVSMAPMRTPLATKPLYPRASSAPVMSLFGLGPGEIAVIAVIAIFVIGPEALAPMAKDLGKSASSLKEVTDSFKEGMAEAETGVSKDAGTKAIQTTGEEVVEKTPIPEAKTEEKAES
mmetsp:Transcript_118655/g.215662  ORF Transcript_118655/g.215662 Transcript_118655/m.215662 type:complete len:196 (+) Transcript_118655:74-661(+)